MNRSFKRVAIISRHYSPVIKETLTQLIQYLLNSKINTVLDRETAENFPDHSSWSADIKIISSEELSQHCDILIVIGGDGSLLQAAHIAIAQNLPILGINRGRLGFLTDILPDHLDKIGPVLEGHYLDEQRLLLTSDITPDTSNKQHKQPSRVLKNDALNDIVLMRGDTGRMLEFDIYINQQFMCNQRADGLIIATPTGSTAYALSGGGPILHPKLDAIVLVPMFPHTLTSRPIVIDSDSIIDIVISPHDATLPGLTHDGRYHVPISAQDKVRIFKKPSSLHLIHPLDYNYFETLQSKLYWERKAHA